MQNMRLTIKEAVLRVSMSLRGRLKRAFRQAVSGQDASGGKRVIYLGGADQAVKGTLEHLYGKKIERVIITYENIKHMYNHHGKRVERELGRGQIPVTEEIVALIPDVLDKPDSVEGGKQTSGYDTINVSKEYSDGTVHLVMAIVGESTIRAHTLWVWNAERTKNEASGDFKTVSGPRQLRTSKSDPTSGVPASSGRP